MEIVLVPIDVVVLTQTMPRQKMIFCAVLAALFLYNMRDEKMQEQQSHTA